MGAVANVSTVHTVAAVSFAPALSAASETVVGGAGVAGRYEPAAAVVDALSAAAGAGELESGSAAVVRCAGPVEAMVEADSEWEQMVDGEMRMDARR